MRATASRNDRHSATSLVFDVVELNSLQRACIALLKPLHSHLERFDHFSDGVGDLRQNIVDAGVAEGHLEVREWEFGTSRLDERADSLSADRARAAVDRLAMSSLRMRLSVGMGGPPRQSKPSSIRARKRNVSAKRPSSDGASRSSHAGHSHAG
jgi:hypothetical protein